MLQRLRRLMILADQDVREALVVPQDDVEPRLQLLDQVRFEQQCFRLARRDDELHAPRQRNHPRDALRLPADLGVVGNTRLEVPRLADIEQLARLAEHAIDSRLARQAAHIVPDHVRPGDALLARSVSRKHIDPGGYLLGLHLDLGRQLLLVLEAFGRLFRQVVFGGGIVRFHGG